MRPPDAVTVMSPEQVEATPTGPEQDSPDTETEAVPHTPVPEMLLLSALPPAGVTVTVIVAEPEDVGLCVTVRRLHDAPLESTWFAEQAPELGAPSENWLVVPEVV